MFPCCLRIGNNIYTHLLHRIKKLPRCHTMTDAGLTRERTLCGVRNEMFRALSSDSYRLFYVTLLLLSVDLLKKKKKIRASLWQMFSFTLGIGYCSSGDYSLNISVSIDLRHLLTEEAAEALQEKKNYVRNSDSTPGKTRIACGSTHRHCQGELNKSCRYLFFLSEYRFKDVMNVLCT